MKRKWSAVTRSPNPTYSNNSSNPTLRIRTQGGNGNDMAAFQGRGGAGEIRVGKDYQAKIPRYKGPEKKRQIQGQSDSALLVWKPTERYTDEEMAEYISIAKENFQYKEDQALGLLFWHRYDIQKAAQELGSYNLHREEWTILEKVSFEQGMLFHGKSFDKIGQMIPDQSMSSIINYYYNWKMEKLKLKKLEEDSISGTNGSGVLASQGHNQNNNMSSTLQHHHHTPMGSMQDQFHSKSDDEVMILEHG